MTEIIRPTNETFSTDSYQNSASPEIRIAKDVAKEFIFTKVGRPLKNSMRKETEVVLRLSQEIELKHEMLLKNEIFNNDINWGRIVVLYTFAGKLAVHCNSSKMESMIDKIINWLGNFVAKKQAWIKEKGRGWSGFLEQFKDTESENEKVWFQGLVATTVGLGTLAAALYIRS